MASMPSIAVDDEVDRSPAGAQHSLPHDAEAITQRPPTRGAQRKKKGIVCSYALLRDPRRDEDQQFVAVVEDRVGLEQPAKQRHPMQERRPVFVFCSWRCRCRR